MNMPLTNDLKFEKLTKDEWLEEVNETLLKLDIQLCDSQGYYRSTYDVFDELCKKWNLLKEGRKWQ